ncbi:helix-turn-helix domain-containing protein, partial [Flammeovirgaceae bacterium SG7u.132]|nr:helix-turn-helix domain-containing protein [Flammeovirgaceae bacterium SG7u.132]
APDTNLSKGTPPKLSDADKAEVVRRYNCGIERSESALGRQFGVSRTTVHKVLVKWGAKKDSPKRSS